MSTTELPLGQPLCDTQAVHAEGTHTSDAASELTQNQVAIAASDFNFGSGQLKIETHSGAAAAEPSSPPVAGGPDAIQPATHQAVNASGSPHSKPEPRWGVFGPCPVPDRDSAAMFWSTQDVDALPGLYTPPSTSLGQSAIDTQAERAEGPHVDSGQCLLATHGSSAAVDPTSTGGHRSRDTQRFTAPGGFLRDPLLGLLADVVDDFESVRIANSNRVRILTRTGVDADGGERGFGLSESHPEVRKLILTVDAMKGAEHDAILNLQRVMRKHPLAPFQKRHKGIGEKQLARLLASIGDPFWNDLHQRPRTVSELWAYCGFHVLHAGGQRHRDTQRRSTPGMAPRRTRGQQSNWSEDARKRTWVIASAMPKFPGGVYEQTYRDARVKYSEATHPADCVRCGPAGKPAPAGSALSDGHKHARAVRITAKAILRDLWIESRDLYETRTA